MAKSQSKSTLSIFFTIDILIEYYLIDKGSYMMIPWVNEVVDVGEELSAHEIIGRLTDANGPVRRLGEEPSRGVYRNLKHLPNAAGLSYILRVSKHYERVLSAKVTTWRRVQ